MSGPLAHRQRVPRDSRIAHARGANATDMIASWPCVRRIYLYISQYKITGFVLFATHQARTRVHRMGHSRPGWSCYGLVVTHRLHSYLDRICGPAGVEGCRVRASGTIVQEHADLLEQLNSAINTRSTIFLRLGTRNMRRVIMKGWLVHHNFFRANENLGGRTPAEAAGAQSPFRGWEDVARAEVGERSDTHPSGAAKGLKRRLLGVCPSNRHIR